MPRFILPGADELSCVDAEGRAHVFTFPFETESPTLIGILRAHGAVEAPTRYQAPEPVPVPEPAPKAAKAAKPEGGEV